jgi:hypothetical protein
MIAMSGFNDVTKRSEIIIFHNKREHCDRELREYYILDIWG